MQAALHARIMRSLGICFIVAVLADLTIDGKTVFGALAALIGIPLLIQLTAAAPATLARWWLGWTIPAAVAVLALRALPWVVDVDPYGCRQLGQMAAGLGAAAYARGMAVWFTQAGWELAAQRFTLAARALAAAFGVWSVVAVGLLVAVEPSPTSDAFDAGTFFGRDLPNEPAAIALGIALFVGVAVSLWMLHRANRFATKALEGVAAAVPEAPVVT